MVIIFRMPNTAPSCKDTAVKRTNMPSGVLEPPSKLRRASCVLLFPNLSSVTMCWWLEISHRGSIYTTEMSKSYKSFFLPREPVVKHLPGQHWTALSLSQHSNRGAQLDIPMYKRFDSSFKKCGKAEEGVIHRETTHTSGRGKALWRLQAERNTAHLRKWKKTSVVSVAGAQNLEGKTVRCKGRLPGFRTCNSVKGGAINKAARPGQRWKEEENDANRRNARFQVSPGHRMVMSNWEPLYPDGKWSSKCR